ncbi:MAG: hypothetical protein ACD_75C00470G0001 [uncultured bacterium]|nr:MAG: hypothetical protein ACD_75C00470G0001 [uncultured bacterium]
MQGTIKHLGQFHRPAGAALDRIVLLNCPDNKDLVAAVDHMEDGLQDFSDLVCFVVGAVEHAGREFHADVTPFELFFPQDCHIFFTGEFVAVKGVDNLCDAQLFRCFTEGCFGAFEAAAEQGVI